MRYLSERRSRLAELSSSSLGFTFVEVMAAMVVTTVVLGAVFSLLASGMRSTPAEIERSDLQAQARQALERMSSDILLAGTDLPLEFPAFTPPGVNPFLDRGDDGPDAIEIVGHFQHDASGSEPVRVVSFDGRTALLETFPTQIERGQLVLIYDDEPIHGSWMFGIVSSVEARPQPALSVVTGSGAAVDEVQLPVFIDRYNRSRPASGFVTPVTVVTYMVDADPAGMVDTDPAGNAPASETLLWRQVDWGPPVQVALVEDLQIRFYVGGTIPDPGLSIQRRRATPRRDDTGSRGEEQELERAPVPQPHPAIRARLDGLVRGVRLHVTIRSHQANLQGSTRLPDQGPDEDGYLRGTYSTRVSARNLLFNLHAKQNLEGFN